jgi:hypothetical protein
MHYNSVIVIIQTCNLKTKIQRLSLHSVFFRHKIGMLEVALSFLVRNSYFQVRRGFETGFSTRILTSFYFQFQSTLVSFSTLEPRSLSVHRTVPKPNFSSCPLLLGSHPTTRLHYGYRLFNAEFELELKP